MRNGEKEVFELAFANGQRIELTAEHRVYTPAGWKRVDELEVGAAVHVQSSELSSLELIPAFYAGALKYLLSKHEGDEIVVTRASHRAFLKPVLDLLGINYHERAKGGLFVSAHHAAIRELDRLDIPSASDEAPVSYTHLTLPTIYSV